MEYNITVSIYLQQIIMKITKTVKMTLSCFAFCTETQLVFFFTQSVLKMIYGTKMYFVKLVVNIKWNWCQYLFYKMKNKYKNKQKFEVSWEAYQIKVKALFITL